MEYRQEYYQGQAEDAARVLSLEMRAKVPAGFFDPVLVNRDYTPLEPDLVDEVAPLSRRFLKLVHLDQGGNLRWQHHANTHRS
jgi:hypothetical protein